MPDYNKSKIYKIISKNTNKIYIGHTTTSLKSRFGGHQSGYKYNLKYDVWLTTWNGHDDIPPKFSKGRVFISSLNILKCGECQIKLIEEYPCHSKDDILKREQFYINKYQLICVNEQKAWLTEEEKYKRRIHSMWENCTCDRCWMKGHIWKYCDRLHRFRKERKIKNNWKHIPENLLNEIRKYNTEIY